MFIIITLLYGIIVLYRCKYCESLRESINIASRKNFSKKED